MNNSPLHKALSQYGVKEIVGHEHNPIIVNYFKEIGYEWILTDETAWCSAFVNWCAKVSGYEYSGKLNARSWMDVGDACEPELGCIVVLWRGSIDGWKGHVGFLVRETDNWLYILGGNQNNQVKISAYHRSKLLGFRKLNQLNT